MGCSREQMWQLLAGVSQVDGEGSKRQRHWRLASVGVRGRVLPALGPSLIISNEKIKFDKKKKFFMKMGEGKRIIVHQ